MREPVEFEVLPGGRSNLTYLVRDADDQRWVLRRPPLASLHSSAHDVLREHRVIAALRPTAVPVPDPVGRCADPDLIGAPFFVMAYVPGTVLVDQATAERTLDPAARARAGAGVVDVLADLHGVDPAAVGLADLGRRDDYVRRQLRGWGRQLDRLDEPDDATRNGATHDGALHDGAAGDGAAHDGAAHDGAGLGRSVRELLREVRGRLSAAVPDCAESVIVHGDFRPGNVIVGADGTVRALLDWELCTLGDPLADLGWLLAYWGSGTAVPLPLPVPTRAAGFPTRDAVLARYANLTGRSVDDIDYYVALALWRLAIILSGVRARLRATGSGAAAAEQADLAERIAILGEAAGAAIRAAGR
ncbi:phosphotransferase family protein [Solwaraspora sp. WMMD1047]|uniref:phosphotransferase family protein n=1 Tax=Solwaraspora sp. WMMD1047 TaxID=3016102 RepID=UPI002416715C|nr:phosphotransferase family protein [Solwaraspora sp. WMMD1047]MDG4834404.1 phosphotransferase family protein [Solwaraspora sp. WMMD1047]